MKIPLSFVELHQPLFLGGKNHQSKIKAGTLQADISLTYDREEKELHIVFSNGQKTHVAILPFTSVASMEPVDPKAAGIDVKLSITPIQPPPAPTKPIKAQASAPNGIKI